VGAKTVWLQPFMTVDVCERVRFWQSCLWFGHKIWRCLG